MSKLKSSLYSNKKFICSVNKDYRRTFNFVAQSITYAKLDYFNKVIKLIVEECSKNEETKTTFRNFICDKIYFLLDEQINALLEYKNSFNFDKLVSALITRKYSAISEDKAERVKTLKEIKKLLNEYKYKDDKMTRNVLYSI